MGNNNCTCCCAHGNAQPDKQPEHTGFLKEYGRILLSAALLFSGIIMKATGMGFFADDTVMFAWYLAAYLPVGLPVLKEAWESILQKDIFSEFTLMSIATLGAFYIKEYPEGVAVMLFYSLGELFQERAVSKAKRNISALIDVRPETATVIKGNEAVVTSPRHVQTGDIIEVKTGERVPLDGKMLDEAAAFNTSALTGESIPRTIRKGGEVLAGMISTDKVIRVEVTRPPYVKLFIFSIEYDASFNKVFRGKRVYFFTLTVKKALTQFLRMNVERTDGTSFKNFGYSARTINVRRNVVRALSFGDLTIDTTKGPCFRYIL